MAQANERLAASQTPSNDSEVEPRDPDDEDHELDGEDLYGGPEDLDRYMASDKEKEARRVLHQAHKRANKQMDELSGLFLKFPIWELTWEQAFFLEHLASCRIVDEYKKEGVEFFEQECSSKECDNTIYTKRSTVEDPEERSSSSESKTCSRCDYIKHKVDRTNNGWIGAGKWLENKTREIQKDLDPDSEWICPRPLIMGSLEGLFNRSLSVEGECKNHTRDVCESLPSAAISGRIEQLRKELKGLQEEMDDVENMLAHAKTDGIREMLDVKRNAVAADVKHREDALSQLEMDLCQVSDHERSMKNTWDEHMTAKILSTSRGPVAQELFDHGYDKRESF